MNNDFHEYQDVVDKITKEFACANLREIVRDKKGQASRAIPEEGRVIMPDGMDREHFASVLVEEICHVCLAPGSNKKEILDAIEVGLGCNVNMAYKVSNYAADLICEFEIARRPSLVELRMPKIQEFLCTSFSDSPTINEIQAIIAQLYNRPYRTSKLFKKISDIMETAQNRVEQFVRISKLLYPIISKEAGTF